MPSSALPKGLRDGWSAGETGWGNELNEDLAQIDAWILEQFGQKRSTTTALTYGYKGGVVVAVGSVSRTADGTVLLTASQTNYVERTVAGVVSANTAGFTAGKLPMAVVATGVATITTVTDYRALFPLVAGGLVSVIAGLDVTGSIRMLTAVSKILAGATSWAVRDAADTISYISIDVASGGNTILRASLSVLNDLTVTGNITGNGAAITALNATQLTTGLVPAARMLAATLDLGNTLVDRLQVDGQGGSTLVAEGNKTGAVGIDLNTGNMHSMVMTGNVTLTLTSPIVGFVYTLALKQDGTGGRTMIWPASVKWAGGTAPTLTTGASKTDIFSLLWDGTNYFATQVGANF